MRGAWAAVAVATCAVRGLEVAFAPAPALGGAWSDAERRVAAEGIAKVRSALVASLAPYPTVAPTVGAVAEFLGLTAWDRAQTVLVLEGRVVVDRSALAAAKTNKFVQLVASALRRGAPIPNVLFAFEGAASGPANRHGCGARRPDDFLDKNAAEHAARDAPFARRYGQCGNQPLVRVDPSNLETRLARSNWGLFGSFLDW